MRRRGRAIVFLALVAPGAFGAALRAAELDRGEGSRLRPLRVSRNGELDAMPSWSPDGRRIVFHSRRAPDDKQKLPTRKLWSAAADGSDARELTDGAGDEYHASYSPDGRKILFVSESSGSRDVWVTSADGSNPVPLTDDPGMEEHPAWSPDGRQIVYAGLPKEGGNFDLWIMNDDGSARRKITFSAANEVFPVWHPDGRTIAFTTDAEGQFDLYGIHLGDEKTFPIVTGPDHETRPAFSPDGRRLAFSRWAAKGSSEDATIWIANADGTAPVPLELPRPSTHPAWSPDGTRLAFQRRFEGDWDVWTLTVPPDLLGSGRLELAAALRGGASADVIRLRGGETLEGSITTETIRLRTPYAAVSFPTEAVAAVEFASLESGTAKLVLANGDSFSGLVENAEVGIATRARRETVRRERIESLGFRVRRSAPAPASAARVAMKNGDLFSAVPKAARLRLRIGDQTVELPFADVARVDFGDVGEKSRVLTRKGESLTAVVENPSIELDLVLGPSLALYPPGIRSLTLREGAP